jgi:pterin-4a-carbinolamine dehydratase
MSELVKTRKKCSKKAGKKSMTVKLRRRPRPILNELKSERVQEMLKAMPGWKMLEDGKAIHCRREFPSAGVASAFAAFVAQFASGRKQAVSLALAGRRVTLLLPGTARPRGTTYGGLTRAVLAFAQTLG